MLPRSLANIIIWSCTSKDGSNNSLLELELCSDKGHVQAFVTWEECVELVYCSACCESLRSARSLRVGDTGRGDEREETGVEQRRGWSYVAGGVVRGTQEAGLKK